MSQVLDLVAHQNPELCILQLGGSSSLTDTILFSLANGPLDTARFSKFVVARGNATDAGDFETIYQDWGSKLAFTVLDEELDLHGQALQPDSFDVIITAATFSCGGQRAQFLRDVSNFLKRGGLFLLLETVNEVLEV